MTKNKTRNIETRRQKMITMYMDEQTALDLMVKRIRHWTDDENKILLYSKMYDRMIDDGTLENIMNCYDCDYTHIVDNDYINNCAMLTKGEDIDFAKVKNLYEKYRYADISGEVFDDYKISNIEAVDDEDEPQYILVRLG